MNIRIHPIFWLIAVLSIVVGQFWELLTLFMIVFIHELGHALVAILFKWKVRQVMILPFGGYCEVDEHGNRPLMEELLVILAGPIQHVFIACIVFVLQLSLVMNDEYALFIQQMNLAILLFNLLPIWPLDGGRLLQVILSQRKSYLDAQNYTLVFSFILLTLLSFSLFVFSPLLIQLWIVLLYLFLSLYSSWKKRNYQFMRFLLERHYGKNEIVTKIKRMDASKNEYVIDVMSKFQRGCKHVIYVKDQEQRERAYDENEVLHAYFSNKQIHAKMKDFIYVD